MDVITYNTVMKGFLQAGMAERCFGILERTFDCFLDDGLDGIES